MITYLLYIFAVTEVGSWPSAEEATSELSEAGQRGLGF